MSSVGFFWTRMGFVGSRCAAGLQGLGLLAGWH